MVNKLKINQKLTSTEERLLLAKMRLCVALGDTSTKAYLSNLKKWFRKVWNKEQFDLECRRLLTPDQRHLHNEFFLAILNKITAQSDSVVSTKNTSGRKRKRRNVMERPVFEPSDIFEYLPENYDYELRSPNAHVPEPRFAADELFLPDTSLILGRLLVVAWEYGLVTADENICELLVMAVQVLLKNILTAVIKARRNFRTTNYGRFFYDVGCAYKNPWVRNTATRAVIDDHPFEVDREIASTSILHRINHESFFLSACENGHQIGNRKPITVKDLYHTLQDRNLIPVHSVYSNNMERMLKYLN